MPEGRPGHVLRHVGKNSRTNPRLLARPGDRPVRADQAEPAFEPPTVGNQIIPPVKPPRG